MAEVTAGLKDEYQKIYDLTYGDVVDMYLNYDPMTQRSMYNSDPSGEHKSAVDSTANTRGSYGKGVVESAVVGGLRGVGINRGIKAGLGYGLTGELSALKGALNPGSLAMGFASSVPANAVRGSLGIKGAFSNIGQTLGGFFGGSLLGPVGGVMGGLAGLLGGDAVADLMDTRKDEAYRDLLEDTFGYFRGRTSYSMAPDSFHTDMLNSVYGSSPSFSSDFSDVDLGSIVSNEPMAQPAPDFSVDFDYLSTPELYYTFNPIGVPTSAYDDGYDSTTFGADIGGLMGGDMDPGGDRMGGLDSTW